MMRVLAMSIVGCFVVAGASCGGSDPMPCTPMMMPGELAERAALLRLDVFDGSVHCDGSTVSEGAPPPSLSKAAPAGTPIQLDIPEGPHTLLLSAFADSAGTQLLASACTETTLSAGLAACFNLTLQATPDLSMAGPDGGEGDLKQACTTSPDNCPVGRYCAADGECAPGCKADSDCTTNSATTDGGVAAALCDVGAHRCVECLKPSDCPAGKRCSPSETCVDGCDVQAGSVCPSSQMCCSNLCIATNDDIASCGGCGRACVSNNVSSLSCAAGLCAPTCLGGFADCNHPVAPAPDDGCETNIYDVNNCGGCGPSYACNLPNAKATCPAGHCEVAQCNPGYFNCSTSIPGCECPGVDKNDGMKGCCAGGTCEVLHSDGLGDQFYDCIAVGNFSQQLAADAAAAFTLTGSPDPMGTFTNTCSSGGTTPDTLFKRSQNQKECAAWGFAGSVKGWVVHVMTNCVCPTGSQTWQ